MKSPLAQFDIISFLPIYIVKYNLDFSINNIIFFLFLGLFIGMFFLNGMVRYIYIIPTNWQFSMEKLFVFVLDIIFEQIGKKGLIYFPFIFALFSFILLFNLLSLLPFSVAVTSYLIWVLYFSTSICLGIFFLGIVNFQIKFFKLFVPKVPLLLYPLMIILEIVSYIIRSFSLGIRLSANMIAGHTLVHIIAMSVHTVLKIKPLVVIIPFLLLIAIFILEIGVACLQAYIFTVLICMYLNESINLIH